MEITHIIVAKGAFFNEVHKWAAEREGVVLLRALNNIKCLFVHTKDESVFKELSGKAAWSRNGTYRAL